MHNLFIWSVLLFLINIKQKVMILYSNIINVIRDHPLIYSFRFCACSIFLFLHVIGCHKLIFIEIIYLFSLFAIYNLIPWNHQDRVGFYFKLLQGNTSIFPKLKRKKTIFFPSEYVSWLIIFHLLEKCLNNMILCQSNMNELKILKLNCNLYCLQIVLTQ